jgi:GntR family transcriptional regulator
MQLTVDPSRPLPPSRQLVESVLNGLAAGEARPGDRLPSVREAAVTARVNPNTVSKAWRELQRLGVVVTRNGSGVFVTDEGPARAKARQGAAALDALEGAIDRALAAGHDPGLVAAFVAERLATSDRKEGER